MNPKSKEETKSGSLSHHSSKREEIIVAWVKEFSSTKSGNNSL